MGIGSLGIGMLIGFATAIWTLATGNSFLLALFAYSLAGTTGTVVAAALLCLGHATFGVDRGEPIRAVPE